MFISVSCVNFNCFQLAFVWQFNDCALNSYFISSDDRVSNIIRTHILLGAVLFVNGKSKIIYRTCSETLAFKIRVTAKWRKVDIHKDQTMGAPCIDMR